MYVQFFDTSTDEEPFREYEGDNLQVDISFNEVILDGKLIATMSRGGELRYFFLEDDKPKDSYLDRAWIRFMCTSVHAYVKPTHEPEPAKPHVQPTCHKCGSELHAFSDSNSRFVHCPICAPINSVTDTEGNELKPEVAQ